MKKYLLTFAVVALAVGVGYFGMFYWQNLRGVGPVMRDPSGDITNQLPQTPREPVNTTNLPLKLPQGFSISVFAKGLQGPRAMIFDQSSRMVVSETAAGKVVVLPDDNVDFVSDQTKTILTGLRKPHGLAFRCEGNTAVQKCYLYVGEEHRIMKYLYNQSEASVSEDTKIADLPSGSGHFTRTLGFGPDKRLYVSIGSSCNVCRESDPRRAAIYSMDANGGDFRSYAIGLRNTVFFLWSPLDGQMWGTDNGRDLLSDDIPPDEINVIREGGNYGWPICYGDNIHDTNFDKNIYIRNPCMTPFEIPAAIALQAHSAPLGLAFISGSGWPKEYQGDLLLAFHGSWNRTEPTGYKIVRIKLGPNGENQGTEDFISGWLASDGKTALGRPVGLITQAGGILYISDDKSGVIYRVTAP